MILLSGVYVPGRRADRHAADPGGAGRAHRLDRAATSSRWRSSSSPSPRSSATTPTRRWRWSISASATPTGLIVLRCVVLAHGGLGRAAGGGDGVQHRRRLDGADGDDQPRRDRRAVGDGGEADAGLLRAARPGSSRGSTAATIPSSATRSTTRSGRATDRARRAARPGARLPVGRTGGALDCRARDAGRGAWTAVSADRPDAGRRRRSRSPGSADFAATRWPSEVLAAAAIVAGRRARCACAWLPATVAPRAPGPSAELAAESARPPTGSARSRWRPRPPRPAGPPPPLPGREAARIEIEARRGRAERHAGRRQPRRRSGSRSTARSRPATATGSRSTCRPGTRGELVASLVTEEASVTLTLFDDAGQALGARPRATRRRGRGCGPRYAASGDVDRPRYLRARADRRGRRTECGRARNLPG